MNRSNEFERPAITPIPDMRNDLTAGQALGETQPYSNQTMDGLRTSGAMSQQGNASGAIAPTAPRPSKIEDIHIQQLDRGFVVKVGCQTMAISDVNELTGKLIAYLTNPDKVREMYFSGLI